MKETESERPGIDALLLGSFEDPEKASAAKQALVQFLLERIPKEALKQALGAGGVQPQEFNTFLLKILAEAQTTKKEKAPINYERALRKESLQIKGALPEAFLLEIKKNLEESAYLSKAQQHYSFFRRTPEDLSIAVNGRPQLIALFSAGYNILCGKIDKILSVKDLQNKLKKGAFEYKLNEQVSVDVAKCAHECLKHYLKETIGECIDKRSNTIDKHLLIKRVFGNIHGSYLLYEEYPPSLSWSDKC
ncbi:hypothetical protein NEDG_02058 [Nematocida displodere]|uniref:Uncharacterized protein n=1 Tax=Nematocida displodere TaxID=1805483 RepID=A0A177EK33_9MICR|nr:hypothetical protein NEDG_02058 [Nematocida displodere]